MIRSRAKHRLLTNITISSSHNVLQTDERDRYYMVQIWLSVHCSEICDLEEECSNDDIG